MPLGLDCTQQKLALIIGQFTQFPAMTESLSIILAFLIRRRLGFYPASKVDSLDSIEGLRYE
jgi:hypothetical protein